MIKSINEAKCKQKWTIIVAGIRERTQAAAMSELNASNEAMNGKSKSALHGSLCLLKCYFIIHQSILCCYFFFFLSFSRFAEYCFNMNRSIV